MQNYPNDPTCPDVDPNDLSRENPAETVSSSPSLTEEAASEVQTHLTDAPGELRDTAGLAAPQAQTDADAGRVYTDGTVSRHTDEDVALILAEVDRKREAERHSAKGNVASSAKRKQAASAPNTGQKRQASQKRGKGKRRPFSFVDVLKYIFPWRGDSGLEAARKLIFFAAMSVFSVCLYLIGDYYIGQYKDGKNYDDIRERLSDTRKNWSNGTETSRPTEIGPGDTVEYLEMNELSTLLKDNPDLVGYITIEGTKVSYPVVQKKSADMNINTNDYYLNRNFFQEYSKSGSIFMDYRCHFDEVIDHHRTVENSDNLIIYGHNMTNESMFGCLRNYMRNKSYYSQHPVVQLQSLYENYTYKIFSVFVVDGEDYTSPYAFDCWNTINFKDEDTFYAYVNNAKKRNIISNDVDVTYGDKILTLYTCSTFIPNGKLILMCRLVRPGEDPKEGTANGHLNDNVLYPKVYYSNHKETFDISRFVPYGPKND